MNYISEINSFYNWAMFNPLPPDAQALWHVLMQMNNRCAVKVNDEWYWRVEFSVPNMTLLSILAFSRQQLDRMRNILIQTGRIVYKKGKGNQSGTYKIIPFDNSVVDNYVDNFPDRLWVCSDSSVSHNVTQSDTQMVTQLDTQSGHKPLHKTDTKEDLCNIFGTLINSNNIKNNNIYNNNSSLDGKEATSSPLQRIISVYQNNIAPITPLVADDIADWLTKLDEDVVEYAIGEAARYNKRTWRYINAILDNHFRAGRTTLAQVKGDSPKKAAVYQDTTGFEYDNLDEIMKNKYGG